MLMYNPLEYSDCYSMASGSLWNDDANEIVANHRLNNSKATTSRSFE